MLKNKNRKNLIISIIIILLLVNLLPSISGNFNEKFSINSNLDFRENNLDSLIFYPTDDTYIHNQHPDTNFDYDDNEFADSTIPLRI